MTIHLKAVEQYLTVFQFNPVFEILEFINNYYFGLGIVESERVGNFNKNYRRFCQIIASLFLW